MLATLAPLSPLCLPPEIIIYRLNPSPHDLPTFQFLPLCNLVRMHRAQHQRTEGCATALPACIQLCTSMSGSSFVHASFCAICSLRISPTVKGTRLACHLHFHGVIESFDHAIVIAADVKPSDGGGVIHIAGPFEFREAFG
jgi:hypothetical protein